MLKKIAIFIITGIIIVGAIFFGPKLMLMMGIGGCTTDEDCVVYGEIGDCNCGCYNKNNLPSRSKEDCFCIPPPACGCVKGKCEATLPF